MKIAVIGSRNWRNKLLIHEIMKEEFQNEYGELNSNELISGGAIGVDSYAEAIFDDWNRCQKSINLEQYKKHIYKPDWNKYGKKAGYLRNQDIVFNADKLIAFWDGKSKGTKHSIDLAIEKGIPIDIYIRN